MTARRLRDAEIAALLLESPWERMQREADADLDEELDRAFGQLVLPDPEPSPVSTSQVRLRATLREPK